MPERRNVSAALSYTGSGAPQVVAAGRGQVAATILERAREAGVPVQGGHGESHRSKPSG
jgi:flagellar biosynthesis protein